MPTIKSTDETFDTLVKENKIIIFDFWATWCAPCTNIAPYLEDISNEYPDWKVCKHNIDEEPNKPTAMGVRGIPTMILFVNGEQKNVKIGATTKSNIISWIKENI
ncbi:MAG: thioredoxin [Pelagibacterales bacterium]|jgi:thioredoxin 1|nr:thioredoxin [Pelagibacterales bacterium]